jgi:hypothetical protein
MSNISYKKSQQPEALAELAKTSRQAMPGDGDRHLTADAQNKPIPTDNKTKHGVAEALLSAGARGDEPDPQQAGVVKLPDRTRVKK